MKNTSSSIANNQDSQHAPVAADILALQNELRRMELDLQLRDETIARMAAELENLRLGVSEQTLASVARQQDDLFLAIAAPAAQLMTQAYLLEIQNKPVQARDILNVARRLLRALETFGLRIEGQVGEVVPFDLNLHRPLNAAVSPREGQSVVIRTPVVRSGTKILALAGVEIAPEQP